MYRAARWRTAESLLRDQRADMAGANRGDELQ